jgi:hypothetical protein
VHLARRPFLFFLRTRSDDDVGSPIVLYWEDHNLSIQSEIKVTEHLMESIFYEISNESSMTSISCRQSLQIIETCCHYLCWELCRHHGLVFHPWDPGPSESMLQREGEASKGVHGRPPPWPPPYKVSKVVQAKSEAQSISSSSPSQAPRSACSKTVAQDTSGLRF